VGTGRGRERSGAVWLSKVVVVAVGSSMVMRLCLHPSRRMRGGSGMRLRKALSLGCSLRRGLMRLRRGDD